MGQVKIKVRGGTTRENEEGLCKSCTHARYRQFQDGRERIKCGWDDAVVRGKVAECSDYQHKNTTPLRDMYDMAWVITPGKEHMGFRQFKKLNQEEKDNVRSSE
jgi:hypothetical protein